MRHNLWVLAGVLIMGGLTVSQCVSAAELGIEGTQFTIDGRPTFLLGFSYYGALGASEEFIAEDLDDLRALGFNWFRVWATWNAYGNDISAVDGKGALREPYLSRLKALIEAANDRGMIVDVTVSRGTSLIPDQPGLLQGWAALATELKPYRNVYFDLANERNVGDARFVSYEELAEVRDRIKAIDPQRLITASHAGGEMPKKAVTPYISVSRVDFIAPHRPRHAGSAEQTEAKTREYVDWVRETGTVVPIHHQEPFRRGYQHWQPSAQDFLTDLAGAVKGGAAGWCFHNGGTKGVEDGRPRRSFDMRPGEGRLMEQLDAQELDFLKRAKATVER